jgi:hypothetical protein
MAHSKKTQQLIDAGMVASISQETNGRYYIDIVGSDLLYRVVGGYDSARAARRALGQNAGWQGWPTHFKTDSGRIVKL